MRPPREMGYRGRQVLDFVRETIAQDGAAPSYREIRDALGFQHKHHVCEVVKRLEKRGVLRRAGSGRVRRIRLVKPPPA